ncbi:hypothetical protein SAMN02910265_03068 [Ruminococcus flavefaciens]|uniref:HTH cro/C1-type domain-containing protein n=1 Tax=Ruminococcus flavefaciens TaxID=1265 RepID=A0A1H6LM55_RUMFL|nr:hypothetical protein [Ruminococcus flavefaciens]SEH85747.1 hypothetical protein SAMN02910265_03068 [Ruminococcus flavefaciens]
MAKKAQRITLYKRIWARIRYWQNLRDISDSELAACLQVSDRTLKEYDRSAQHITLEKLDNFLYVNGMEFSDLMSL